MALEAFAGNPRSAHPAGTESSLSADNGLASLLPWEWVLENLLDLQQLPLSFFEVFTGYIPHIEDARCSRLLQKVALRYLYEAAAVTRKVDACAIPLIRFVLKEQGISNLHRIHSLKESFENDLMLRVETEAVLMSLRCDTGEGVRNWEAYDDALKRVFPEDTCEPREFERRNELIAVSRDRLKGDPQKNLCEQLLTKYPLEELLRDILHFVEDKKKFFKTKFLDQLFEDIGNGVYSLSSTTLSPGKLEVSTPRVDGDSPGCHQVSDPLQTGHETCKERDSRGTIFTPMAGSCKVFSGIAHEASSPAEEKNGPDISGLVSVPCKNDMPTSITEEENCDAHNQRLGNLVGAKVTVQEDFREEMSFRMVEVDKVAGGLAHEINELVNDISKFANDVHNAAGICTATPDLDNQPASNLDATISQNPVLIQQNSEKDLSAQRVDFDMDINQPAEDHMTTRKNADNALVTECEFLKAWRERRNTSSEQKNRRISSPTTGAHICKDTKRIAVETPDQNMCVAKKGKHHDSEEPEGQRKKRNQSSIWTMDVEKTAVCEGEILNKLVVDTTDDVGGRFSPIVIKHDMEGPSRSRLSIESGDMAVSFIDEDESDEEYHVTGKRGAYNKRVCLRRSSKDGQSSPMKSIEIPHELKLPVNGVSDGEQKAKCYLCEEVGDVQIMCHMCRLSVHDSCLGGLSTSQAADGNGWCCPSCAHKIAKEAVRKAKEDLKKAREDSLKAKERFVTFLSSKQDFCEANDGLIEPKQRIDSINVLGAMERTICLGTITELVGSASHPLPQSPEPQDLMRHGSSIAQGIKVQTSPETSAQNKTNASRSIPVMDTNNLREPVRQESSSVLRVPVAQHMPLGGNQTFGAGGKQSGPLESFTDRKNPLASQNSESLKGTGGDAKSANDQHFDILNPGVEDGDGHDGDLEEVCEGKTIDANGDQVVEQAVDAGVMDHISNVAVASSRRHHVYRGRSQIPGIRRRNLPWTTVEEDALKEGVQMFSNGGEWGFQWKRILEHGYGKFHSSRNTVDLKDKWRNMGKGTSITEDSS